MSDKHSDTNMRHFRSRAAQPKIPGIKNYKPTAPIKNKIAYEQDLSAISNEMTPVNFMHVGVDRHRGRENMAMSKRDYYDFMKEGFQ